MERNNHGNFQGGSQPLSKGLCSEKLPSELVTQIEKLPLLPQKVEMEESCKTLWRMTSHF